MPRVWVGYRKRLKAVDNTKVRGAVDGPLGKLKLNKWKIIRLGDTLVKAVNPEILCPEPVALFEGRRESHFRIGAVAAVLPILASGNPIHFDTHREIPAALDAGTPKDIVSAAQFVATAAFGVISGRKLAPSISEQSLGALVPTGYRPIELLAKDGII